MRERPFHLVSVFLLCFGVACQEPRPHALGPYPPQDGQPAEVGRDVAPLDAGAVTGQENSGISDGPSGADSSQGSEIDAAPGPNPIPDAALTASDGSPGAVPCSGVRPETCDGLDNDCNGQVDEALTRPCEAACGTGTQTCMGGTWSACSGKRNPSAETCNDLDDDCDGQTDEDLTSPCSNDCGRGNMRCVGGTFDMSTCTAPRPSPEACDGADNDCDGRSDEDLTAPCSFGCGNGTMRCANGSFDMSTCSARKPACGGRCESCPSPANGRAVCANGQCDFDCLSGKKCDGGCFQCCQSQDCPARVNETASCNPSHTCDYSCNGVRCGNRCTPLTGTCLALTFSGSGTISSACGEPHLCSPPSCAPPNVSRTEIATGSDLDTVSLQCNSRAAALLEDLCNAAPIVARRRAGEDVIARVYSIIYRVDGSFNDERMSSGTICPAIP